MPLATSAKVAAACSLAGLATATEGANVLDGASAGEKIFLKKCQFNVWNRKSKPKSNFRCPPALTLCGGTRKQRGHGAGDGGSHLVVSVALDRRVVEAVGRSEALGG